MANISPRFGRAAVRSRTITGGTSVGGASSTTVGIYPDGSIRFVDRSGKTQVISGAAPPANVGTMLGQPSSRAFQDDPQTALWQLVDVLIART